MQIWPYRYLKNDFIIPRYQGIVMVTDIVLYFSRQFLQNVVLSIQGFLAANEIYYENHYTESQLLEVNTIEYVQNY